MRRALHRASRWLQMHEVEGGGRLQPAFLEFAVGSPLGGIVARALRGDRVWFYEDSVLVKEPGSNERTALHQDMAYFRLEGDLVCTTWVPLDPVTAETGAVRFVVGSHRDRTKYRPNMFVTTMALPGTEGVDVPDYDQRVGAARIVSFDTEPGTSPCTMRGRFTVPMRMRAPRSAVGRSASGSPGTAPCLLSWRTLFPSPTTRRCSRVSRSTTRRARWPGRP